MNDIFCLKTSNTNKLVLIDSEDKDEVLSHHTDWYEQKSGQIHCRSRITHEKIALHRLVMKAKEGAIVDHKFNRRWDNRKSQLRICSSLQNNANARLRIDSRTGYKGVSPFQGKYTAQIRVNRKLIYLGYFKNPVDAAKAYNVAAIKYFGEFAILNKVD